MLLIFSKSDYGSCFWIVIILIGQKLVNIYTIQVYLLSMLVGVFWRMITISFKIFITHLAGCLKTLPTNGPFECNIFFFSKVANIKSKSATIAFFSLPPIFLFAHSFSPFPFLQFVSEILELTGPENPTF